MTASSPGTPHEAPDFDGLRRTCAASGPAAMFDALAASLARRNRWHALFDARIMQARVTLGLPASGDLGTVTAATRDQLDELSLAACREAGWPLLEEGQIANAWMYLRAAAEPGEVAHKLAALAAGLEEAPEDDEEAARQTQELVGVALWEGVDPALGLAVVLRTQGTCNAITTYEQAVSRLPAARQRSAASLLVSHLHGEVAANLAADLSRRGVAGPTVTTATPIATPIMDLLESAGGLRDDPSIHVDVSHLQSVLRIARVCDDEPTLRKAWELACYGDRLPADVVYPGEPPFENVAQASRLWYAAHLGLDAEKAVTFFRKAAVTARLEQAGTLPCDTLVLLLWRLGRPAEALHAALERPADDGMPSAMQAAGMLPSLVELAAASGDWTALRTACQQRGDEITFAATLAAEGNPLQSTNRQPPLR